MAVRTDETAASRTWLVALSLLALFAVALFLRAYWNLDAAHKPDGTFVLSGGSDPYYHKRAVDWIQDNGWTTLIFDPLLNYPFGANNPNPPLYEWSIAVGGQLLAPFFDGNVDTATWWATVWSPSLYGALTVFPIYFIGKAIWDRRVGMVAALFWTLSTSAIDASGLGDADHDAAVMFFASLAFLFYIQALARFRGDGNWVADWRRGDTVAPGLGRFFRERRVAIGYSLLAGVSVGAVALIWKGFPYVIGIMFAYACIQMLLDHWRSRDSLGLFVGTFLAITVGTLLAYPYYAQAEVSNFLQPVWFIIVGFLIAGLVLVPTRDFPTILVFPAAIVVALVAGLVAFFVLPDVARSLLYATVYFKQTALYETIAEAHPADFSNMVFGIGVVPFLVGAITWIVLLFNVRKLSGRPILFALVWGAIALYMAHSAIRFLFNAMPIFAVFGAIGLVWIVDWLDFATIRKSLAANRGNFWTGFRRGVRPMQIVGVVLMVLLLVVPNVMLAADAALPPENEQRIADNSESQFVKDFMVKRFGAYGQGFIPDYWHDGLVWLDQHDAGVPPADRPAFLAWWDYGHWAIAIANHPTVADNFQNGYVPAAHFILSQNETHAIQLMAGRLADLPDANAEQELRTVGVSDPLAALEDMREYRFVDELTTDKALQVLKALEANTGKKIRYFAADIRMLPYDNPQTPSIEQSSIFYAPVKLALQNPDDYVSTQIQVGGTTRYVSQEEFTNLARNPITQVSGSAERLQFTEKFFNSMYYRAYVGAPPAGPFPTTGDAVLDGLNDPRPGQGLEHFRLVYANEGVKILEFYYGATIAGTVLEDGAPVAGASVAVLDDSGQLLYDSFPEAARATLTPEQFNSVHAFTTTDDQGRFTLVSPFGDNLTVIAQKDGVELARKNLQVTRDEAETGATKTVELTLVSGAVSGIVFQDKDGDGAYGASNDTPIEGVSLTVGGKSGTSGAGGAYTISGVPAGVQNATVEDSNYTVAPRSSRVRVAPSETTTLDVALDLRPATVSGRVFADLDGDGNLSENESLPSQPVTFAIDANVADNGARNSTASTDQDGAYTIPLAPGSYVVTSSWTAEDGSIYSAEGALQVGVGQTVTFDLRLVKQ